MELPPSPHLPPPPPQAAVAEQEATGVGLQAVTSVLAEGVIATERDRSTSFG